MTTEHTTKRDFVDTGFARLLGALLAVAIAVLLYMNWGDEFKQLASGTPEVSALPAAVTSPGATSAINPALASCLEKRIGDVDQMKSDGVLSDAQYANFRARAESLCRQTNPE